MEKFVNARDICDRSAANARNILEKIARLNALNRTGNANYNKYGNKDGIGFTPCSDKFVDNSILQVLVPDYILDKTKYLHVGAVNKTIRDLLARRNLTKCKVKAIGLKPGSLKTRYAKQVFGAHATSR